MPTLGTKAADLEELDNSNIDKATEVRIQAMAKRDELESNGFGDQLMEIQEASCPGVDKLKTGKFKIDMLFQYDEDNEAVLSWCQGTVTKVIRESGNIIIAEIEWDDNYVKDGDPSKTREELKRNRWNREEQIDGTWREDLRHLMVSSE